MSANDEVPLSMDSIELPIQGGQNQVICEIYYVPRRIEPETG